MSSLYGFKQGMSYQLKEEKLDRLLSTTLINAHSTNHYAYKAFHKVG